MKLFQKHIYTCLSFFALIFLTGYTGITGGCVGPVPIVIPLPSSCAVECVAIHMDETSLNECGVPLQACASSCALEAESQGANQQTVFNNCYSANCKQPYEDCTSAAAEATYLCMEGKIEPFVCPIEEYQITREVNITMMKGLAIDNHTQAFENMLENTGAELSTETENAINFSLLDMTVAQVASVHNRFKAIYMAVLF